MKALAALILASITITVLIFASPTLAYDEPFVGVKPGDWMEYTVSITGLTAAPAHNISSFRIEILDVVDTAFHANVTVRNVNGSVSSSIWNFNFTEGNLEGWVIIPANLGVGDSFFDSAKPGYITIEGIQEKVVAGATRTITQSRDEERLIKEWDKATGFYTYSLEKPKNFTVISTAVDTNLWSPDLSEQKLTSFDLLVAAGLVLVIAVAVLFSTLLIVKRNGVNLKSALLKRAKALTIFLTILLMGVAMSLIGFFQSQITMSFHELNLILQTVWSAILVGSMCFRAKGHYLLHGITWIVAVTITLFNFAAVIVTASPSDQSLAVFFSSPAYAAEFISHTLLSFPALILAVWFIVIWKPDSTSFVAKTQKIALATTILWVLSYIAGVLGYIALYTNYFG